MKLSERRVEDSNPYLDGTPGIRSRLQTIPRHPPKRRDAESNCNHTGSHPLATGFRPSRTIPPTLFSARNSMIGGRAWT